ncbi:MAG: hypothetical protein DMG39_27885 [Acidobacteria bacterium]|nr:MAG: hypothetical protein DMG39_27885 [Acidobacteriota bacterium]
MATPAQLTKFWPQVSVDDIVTNQVGFSRKPTSQGVTTYAPPKCPSSLHGKIVFVDETITTELALN